MLVDGMNPQFYFITELAPYFNLLPVGPTVTISLDSEIPNELVPANGIIMLELEATAPGATSALATVVLEVVQNDTVFEQLVFSETFYTGQYTELGGLNFTNIIKLDQGYDENVLFTLEGGLIYIYYDHWYHCRL